MIFPTANKKRILPGPLNWRGLKSGGAGGISTLSVRFRKQIELAAYLDEGNGEQTKAMRPTPLFWESEPAE